MVGGGGIVILHRLDPTDHSKFMTPAGVLIVGTPPVPDIALTLKDDGAKQAIIETMAPTLDEAGIPTWDITHTLAETEFWAFAKVAAPPKQGVSSVTIEELISEAGTKIGGSASTTNPNYLLVHVGGFNAAQSHRFVSMCVGTFKKTMGSHTTGAGKFVKPKTEFVAMAANQNIEIPQALFANTGLNATISAGLRTIEKDFYIHREYIPKAA